MILGILVIHQLLQYSEGSYTPRVDTAETWKYSDLQCLETMGANHCR